MNNPHYNPELKVTACPIPPSDAELAARRELDARLTRDAEGLDSRVAKLVQEADVLRQARSQPITMPSPEVITLLAEERRKRRGL
jgi:hypothetical protein